MKSYTIASEGGTNSIQAASPREAARYGRTPGMECYVIPQEQSPIERFWVVGPRGGFRVATKKEVAKYNDVA